MDVRVVVLWLTMASPLASAQQVFKCVDGERVSYQSEPCPGQATRAWDASPAPFDPYKAARVETMRRQIAQENAARNAPKYRRRSSAQVRQSSANDCVAVKAQRDAAYARVGLQRTFKFSSDWDNRVQQACK